ncbi:hypothetical protein L3Q82_010288, partial [Scortum barcoo]
AEHAELPSLSLNMDLIPSRSVLLRDKCMFVELTELCRQVPERLVALSFDMSGAVFTQPVARQPLPNRLVDEGSCKAAGVDVVMRVSVQGSLGSLCVCVWHCGLTIATRFSVFYALASRPADEVRVKAEAGNGRATWEIIQLSDQRGHTRGLITSSSTATQPTRRPRAALRKPHQIPHALQELFGRPGHRSASSRLPPPTAAWQHRRAAAQSQECIAAWKDSPRGAGMTRSAVLLQPPPLLLLVGFRWGQLECNDEMEKFQRSEHSHAEGSGPKEAPHQDNGECKQREVEGGEQELKCKCGPLGIIAPGERAWADGQPAALKSFSHSAESGASYGIIGTTGVRLVIAQSWTAEGELFPALGPRTVDMTTTQRQMWTSPVVQAEQLSTPSPPHPKLIPPKLIPLDGCELAQGQKRRERSSGMAR